MGKLRLSESSLGEAKTENGKLKTFSYPFSDFSFFTL